MRRWATAALLLALALGACGGGGDGSDGGEDDSGAGGGDVSTGSTTAAGEFDPDAVTIYVAEGSAVSRIEPAGDSTTELIGGLSDCYETWFLEGSVWVSCTAGRLLRLDPESGEIQLDVETGNYIEEITIGEGALWVLNGQQGIATDIKKVDLDSGEVLATVAPEAGAFFWDVSAGEGAVLAVGGSVETISTVARIDPVTATVSMLIDTGMGPERVEAGYGWVYAVGGGFLNADGTGNQGLRLVRIDPSSNEVVSEVSVSEQDGFPDLALAYESVWVTDTAAGELVRVDQAAETEEARVSIGSGGADIYEIDVAKGLVWGGNPFDNQIFGIDPTSNEFDTGIDGGASGIAFAP